MTKRQIYKEIAGKLKSGLPDFKWIGMNKGQFARLQSSYPMPRPCALVSIKSVKWSTGVKKVQNGLMRVEISLFIDVVNDTPEGAINEDEALMLLDYSDAVYTALQGFQGESFKPLSRVEDKDGQHTGLISTWSVAFETEITDTTRKPNYQKTEAEPTITVTINEQNN